MIVNNVGISESVEKVYDAVVMVKNMKNGRENGSGSGFVYKKDDKYGYVMTNYHVVDGSTSVKIRTTSEEEFEGKVLGGDEYIDIAVIRIPVEKVIAVAKIGSTETLKRGEQVFAIGTPVGEEYFNTVTSGYISGLNRKITVSVKTNNDWVQEVVQMDASINPGNSGGPLLNFNGEVIGVNSMKLVDSSIEGMGFSIKIEDAMKHVSTFEEEKNVVSAVGNLESLIPEEKAAIFRDPVGVRYKYSFDDENSKLYDDLVPNRGYYIADFIWYTMIANSNDAEWENDEAES